MARPKLNPLQLVYSLPRFYAGNMYMVDSTYGSNSERGTDNGRPVRSITYAMTKCVDDLDDVVVVMPGYDNDLTDAETNGDDTPIILDKNGVTVLFVGRNNTVKGITADDSIFQIDAEQVTLGVIGDLPDIIGGGTLENQITIAAAAAGTAGTVVEVKAGAIDAEVFGFNTDSCDGYDELITVDATAHRANIHHCNLIGDSSDTDEGIIIAGTNQESHVHHCSLYTCALGTAGISIPAAAVLCEVSYNILYHLAASKYGVKAHASATGVIHNNFIVTHASHTAKATSGAKMYHFENYVPSAVSKSGLILPAIA